MPWWNSPFGVGAAVALVGSLVGTLAGYGKEAVTSSMLMGMIVALMIENGRKS